MFEEEAIVLGMLCDRIKHLDSGNRCVAILCPGTTTSFNIIVLEKWRVISLFLFFLIERCYRNRLCKASNRSADDDWKTTRLNRYIVDYLLREGFYQTAAEYAAATNTTTLTNVHMFAEAKVCLLPCLLSFNFAVVIL